MPCLRVCVCVLQVYRFTHWAEEKGDYKVSLQVRPRGHYCDQGVSMGERDLDCPAVRAVA